MLPALKGDNKKKKKKKGEIVYCGFLSYTTKKTTKNEGQL